MPAAYRLALPPITLLAALCGSASAEMAGNTASLRLDTATPSWTTSAAAPSAQGGGMAPLPQGRASPRSTAPAIDAGRPSAMQLRRTSSSRRAVALSASDPTATRTRATGGLLPRLSTPDTWTQAAGGATPMVAPMGLDQVLGRSDRTLETTDTKLAGGLQFSRTRLKRSDTSVARRLESMRRLPADASGEQPLSSASMLQLRTASGTALSAGRGGLASRSLGLSESHLAPRLAGIEAVVANPLLAFTTDNRFASMSTPLTSAWSARVASVRSRACGQNCANVDLLELTHQGRRHALNLSMGLMREDAGAQGTDDAPHLGARAPQTTTTGLTVSAAWALTREWLAAASYSVARTRARLGDDLPATVASNGYGLGLLKNDTWRPGDRLSLTLLAPLAAQSGQALDDDAANSASTPRGGTRLAPDAREWTLETRYYTTRLPGDSALTAVAAFKQNPEHDASATSQMALGVRYNRPF